MTKLVLPLLLTACVSTEPATESQRDQAVSPGGYHEVFRGTEATVNFADLATRISIDVFENGSNQFPGETYLFYSTDAQITPGAAHVHSSTSVAGFTTMQCTFDERDYSNACTDGVAGSINLAWQRDGQSTTFSNGMYRETTTSYSSQRTGMYWTASAQARGTLPGGHVFEAASATLNVSRGNSVSKSLDIGLQHP